MIPESRIVAFRIIPRLAAFPLISAFLILEPAWSENMQGLLEAGRKSYKTGDYDGALRSCRQGLRNAVAANDSKSQSLFYRCLGNTEHLSSHLAMAAADYEKAVKIARAIGDREDEAKALANLGAVYRDLGDMPKSLDVEARALNLAEKTGDKPLQAAALGNLGGTYYSQGDFPKALAAFKQALVINAVVRNPQIEAQVLSDIAGTYVLLADQTNAFDYNARALSAAGRAGSTKLEASIAERNGRLHQQLGKYSNAAGDFTKALQLIRKLDATMRPSMGNDDRDEISVLRNLAWTCVKLENQGAGDSGRQALADAKRIGGPELEVYVLLQRAANDAGSFVYSSALRYCEQALAIAGEIKNEKLRAAALAYKGEIHRMMNDFPQALQCFRLGLTIAIGSGDIANQITLLNELGLVFKTFGDYPKALDHFSRALDLLKEATDGAAQAAVLGNLGDIYRGIGDDAKAKDLYDQALELARHTRNKGTEGELLSHVGVSLLDQGEYAKAAENMSRALKIATESGSREAQLNTLYPLGIAMLHLGRTKDAYDYFARLDSMAGPSNDLGLAMYYLFQRDYSAALKRFQHNIAESKAKRLDERLVAFHLGTALSYEGLGDNASAAGHFRSAAEEVEQIRLRLPQSGRARYFESKDFEFPRTTAFEGLVRMEHSLGRDREAFHQSEFIKARYFSESAAKKYGKAQSGIPAAIAQREEQLIDDIASALRQKESSFEHGDLQAVNSLERELARLNKDHESLVAQLRRDYPEYASVNYPEPIYAENIPLAQDEALISFAISDSYSLAFVVKNGRIAAVQKIDVSRQELTALVEKHLRGFEGILKSSQLADYDPLLGERLYKLLLKPLLDQGAISKSDRLIIVPDGILAALPFESLVVKSPPRTQILNGKHGPFFAGVEYVGDSYDIAYWQSATALASARSLRRSGAKGNALFVLADPVFGPQDARWNPNGRSASATNAHQRPSIKAMGVTGIKVRGDGTSSQPDAYFPRLEKTSELARRLAESFGAENTVLLVGPSAGKHDFQNLESSLVRFRYLVFATHGILDDTLPYVKEPALVLNQVDQAAGDNGMLTMSEVMGLKLDADVVALTACRTGLGRTIRGEGIMGLGRAFQYAGAKAVLVSLWSVAEDSTTMFAERFFAHLKAGLSKREALKAARREVRRAGYENPFYWSAFVLVGD